MIKGKYVGLRALEKDDLPILQEWRNNESFRRNFREVRELSLFDQERWFESLSQSKQNNFMFVIVELSTGEIIGAVGILYINWIIRSGDISYYIGKNNIYVDKSNISLESSHLLLNYAFNNLNLNKVWMELYEFDSKKIDFFSSEFNFHRDAVLRENCFEGGKFHNSYIYSLLQNEYRKQ